MQHPSRRYAIGIEHVSIGPLGPVQRDRVFANEPPCVVRTAAWSENFRCQANRFRVAYYERPTAVTNQLRRLEAPDNVAYSPSQP